MKLVAHISDLHFGSHDPRIEDALVADLNGGTAGRPTLVAISGDLTQRARRSQFAEARRFLRRLEVPWLAVPGNHDVPLYDVFTRLVRARARYCRYITDDLAPFHADDELAVAGIDTVKRFTIKDGEVHRDAIARVCDRLRLHADRWKLLVAHHPFVVPSDVRGADQDLVNGHEMAVPLLEDARVDLILSGHLHIPYAAGIAGRNDAHTIIAVHAGSCLSTRLRGHPNGYNHLAFDGTHCRITSRIWNGTRFIDGDGKSYHRGSPQERERLIKEAGSGAGAAQPRIPA